MSIPPNFSLVTLLEFALYPRWLMNFTLHPKFELSNIIHKVDLLTEGNMGVIKYVNQQFDRAITWDDAEWLAKQWDGPFIIKSLMSGADAKTPRCWGNSNHGIEQWRPTNGFHASNFRLYKIHSQYHWQ